MINKKWFVKHFYKGFTPNHADYKVMLLTFKALNDIATPYLADLSKHYSSSRPLCTADAGLLLIPGITYNLLEGLFFLYSS